MWEAEAEDSLLREQDRFDEVITDLHHFDAVECEHGIEGIDGFLFAERSLSLKCYGRVGSAKDLRTIQLATY